MTLHPMLRRLLLAAVTGFGLLAGSALSTAQAESRYDFAVLPADTSGGQLMLADDGNFYGVYLGSPDTSSGVYRLTPAGALTILYSFTELQIYPYGPIVRTADGSLYGTHQSGGAGGNGAVWKLAVDGTFTLLHSFAAGAPTNADGAEPVGLALGSDGNLYGICAVGGADGSGTVYRITTAGSFTLLHDFRLAQASTYGLHPVAPPLMARDGNLYGTTKQGGPNDTGILYRIDPADTLSVFYAFSAIDGVSSASPIQAADGYLYAATLVGGGAYGQGTVYRIDLSGTLTSLHSFAPVDGFVPVGPLAPAPDGSIYGVNSVGSVGSVNGSGALFKVSLSGDFDLVHPYMSPFRGQTVIPFSGPVIGADGAIYGVMGRWTENPPMRENVVYRLEPASSFSATVTMTPDAVTSGSWVSIDWSAPGAQSCTLILRGSRRVTFPGIPPEGSRSFRLIQPGTYLSGFACVAPDGGQSSGASSTVVSRP